MCFVSLIPELLQFVYIYVFNSTPKRKKNNLKYNLNYYKNYYFMVAEIIILSALGQGCDLKMPYANEQLSLWDRGLQWLKLSW